MEALKLDVNLAQALITRTIAQARQQFAKPVCVSVCDASGFLLAFGRAAGAPLRSIAIAQQKAYSATRMGVSTAAFLARLRTDEIEISFFCDPLLTALPGGALLSDASGTTLGAVGISGLTSAQDQELADGGTAFIAEHGAQVG
jgi:uncharacterized protein GlcG (DUF336 family)